MEPPASTELVLNRTGDVIDMSVSLPKKEASRRPKDNLFDSKTVVLSKTLHSPPEAARPRANREHDRTQKLFVRQL